MQKSITKIININKKRFWIWVYFLEMNKLIICGQLLVDIMHFITFPKNCVLIHHQYKTSMCDAMVQKLSKFFKFSLKLFLSFKVCQKVLLYCSNTLLHIHLSLPALSWDIVILTHIMRNTRKKSYLFSAGRSEAWWDL